MPFGAVGRREFGTYFIGYARHPDVIERMLTNMFIGDPPGTTDRILDFSTALTGNLFFIPNADLLDNPPTPGQRASRDHADTPATPDESLRIGSLKRTPGPPT
jgi:putative iron-dependent peroxidase